MVASLLPLFKGDLMTKVQLNRYLFTLMAFSVFSVSAQDSSDESIDLIEDVIVTARRREETAQSVPVAISAFSSDDLSSRNITTTDDLDNIAPNLSFFQDGAVGNEQRKKKKCLSVLECPRGRDPPVPGAALALAVGAAACAGEEGVEELEGE